MNTATTDSQASSDLSKLANVFITLLIFIATGITVVTSLTVEFFANDRPGLIELDRNELDQATKLVSERRTRVNSLKQSVAELDIRLQKRTRELQADRQRALTAERSDLVETKSPVGPGVTKKLGWTDELRLAARQRPGQPRDPITNAYVSLLLRVSNSTDSSMLQSLASFAPDQKQAFAEVIEKSTKMGLNDPVRAATVLDRLPNEAAKVANLRWLLEHPETMPLPGAYANQSDGMVLLLRATEMLPAPEQVDAVIGLMQLDESKGDQVVQDLRGVVIRWDSAISRDGLAPLMLHHNPEVRTWVRTQVSRESAMQQVLSAIRGDDYHQFVLAIEWLADQPTRSFSDKQIAGVLQALEPCLLVTQSGVALPLEIYVRTINERQVVSFTEKQRSAIAAYLAKPLSELTMVDLLIDVSIKMDVSLASVIESASGVVADRLMVRYLQKDRSVKQGFVKMLSEDSPNLRTLSWIARISREGSRSELSDLREAVKSMNERAPKRISTLKAEEILLSMENRLHSEPSQ